MKNKIDCSHKISVGNQNFHQKFSFFASSKFPVLKWIKHRRNFLHQPIAHPSSPVATVWHPLSLNPVILKTAVSAALLERKTEFLHQIHRVNLLRTAKIVEHQEIIWLKMATLILIANHSRHVPIAAYQKTTRRLVTRTKFAANAELKVPTRRN